MTEPAGPPSEPGATGGGPADEPVVPPRPGPAPPPPGYASSDDKTWALLSHFGGAAGMVVGGGTLGWVVPLIIMLARGDQSPTVRAHAVAALNFQLLWSIVAAAGYITLCVVIGFVIVPVAWLMGVIFGIIAGVRANDGQLFRYPATYPLIK